tara:strand:- start:4750 stop:4998 length:249 start_codon:yes stop_codon:yes gene_type:complete
MIYDPETSRVFLKAVGVCPDDYYWTERGMRWQPEAANLPNTRGGNRAVVNPRTCLSRLKASEKEARLQASFFGCGVAGHPAW